MSDDKRPYAAMKALWKAAHGRIKFGRVTTIVYSDGGVAIFDRDLTPDEVARQYEAWKSSRP